MLTMLSITFRMQFPMQLLFSLLASYDVHKWNITKFGAMSSNMDTKHRVRSIQSNCVCYF